MTHSPFSANPYFRDWLSRIDKDSKEARNRQIFDLWMACYTQEEIGEIVNTSKMEVSRVCNEMAELPNSYKPAADHLTDFNPPVYNVWKFRERTSGNSHFGNTEPAILDLSKVFTCNGARNFT